jgi:hypothetical protein
MAYGFRNIDNMMAMIMHRCSGIKVQLPWEQKKWVSFFTDASLLFEIENFIHVKHQIYILLFFQ